MTDRFDLLHDGAGVVASVQVTWSERVPAVILAAARSAITLGRLGGFRLERVIDAAAADKSGWQP